MTLNLLQAVKVVRHARDKKWKPMTYRKEFTFFSKSDVWHYISISDDRRCQYCEEFDGFDYFGDELRKFFPDLIIRSPNVIDVHIHKTLWDKDNCRCKVVRVFLPEGEAEKINKSELSKYVKEHLM